MLIWIRALHRANNCLTPFIQWSQWIKLTRRNFLLFKWPLIRNKISYSPRLCSLNKCIWIHIPWVVNFDFWHSSCNIRYIQSISNELIWLNWISWNICRDPVYRINRVTLSSCFEFSNLRSSTLILTKCTGMSSTLRLSLVISNFYIFV
jgi:hypothetical protein